MLQKSRISKIKVYSEEWFSARLGKFTSSEISFIMGEKFDTLGCYSYIYRKVGEFMSGQAIKVEIENDYTRWGALHEAEAIRKFGKHFGLDFIVCQQLITEENSRFGSTPDGLIVHRESLDGLQYEVSTLEVKCPPTFQNYIPLALCKTPQDVKKVNSQYYWQVLDQMDNCDALMGYFVIYHPDLKKGNMNIVEFRKMQPTGIVFGKEIPYPLVSDIKLLKERKKMAEQKFSIVKEELELMGSF